MISEALTKVQHLLDQYRIIIRAANTFKPSESGYLENYKQADFIEKRIKTEIYKYVTESIERQLDDVEKQIREEKISKDA
jgi:hypothetical protein